jgi:hypothetical protein
MNPEIRPDFDSTHQPVNLDPLTFDPTNPNNTGYHELIEPPILPLGSYPDPLNDSRYYNQAGVIVQVTDNGSSDTVTILRPTGDGGATPCTSGSPANSEEKTAFNMFSASG